jgi:predicted TIM-barrel fold metal-dependent hydrolase
MPVLPRIDMHSHYFPITYYKLLDKYHIIHPDNVYVPDWKLDKHLSDMEKANIIYTCLSITSPFFNFVNTAEERAEAAKNCNDEGAVIAAAYPGKIGLLAALPLPDISESIAEIERCAGLPGIKGFALPTNAHGIYMGNPVLVPVYEALDRIEAIVTLHPTTPSAFPENVCETLPIPLFEFYVDTTRAILNMVYRDVFKRFPNIKFIMPHAGGCFSTMTGRLSSGAGAALDIVGNMKRMYFDLAGSPVPVQLQVLKQTVGIERLVYGVDFPYPSLEAALQHGDMIDGTELLSDAERNQIYIGNAKQLLNI